MLQPSYIGNTTFAAPILFFCFSVLVACSPSSTKTNSNQPTHGEGPPSSPPASTKTPNAVLDAGSSTSQQKPYVGWTTFRGNSQRTGRVSVKGPRQANVKWVFRTKGRVYADASVSADGETIYVASHDHNLYAIGKNGREKWSFDTGNKIWTTPTIAKDGTIYIGHDGDRLLAISPQGNKMWEFSTEPEKQSKDKPEAGRYDVDTSPVLLSDGSIVFGSNTTLFALRPLSGGLRWFFEAGTGRAKIFTSPAIGNDGSIYFGTQANFFFGINQSAKVLWHLKTNGDNDSTPAVGDDGTIYFGSDDGKLRAVAPGGTLRWEAHIKAPIRAPIAVGHDGRIFVSTYGNNPFIAAYSPDTGQEIWRFHTNHGEGDFFGIQSGALIDSEGYIYFGGRDHFVYCLSPKGKQIWKYETGDQIDSSPSIGPDGTLYVGSDDHRLYAFSR